MDQLDDLLAGAEATLDDDVLDRIDEIVAPGNRRRRARYGLPAARAAENEPPSAPSGRSQRKAPSSNELSWHSPSSTTMPSARPPTSGKTNRLAIAERARRRESDSVHAAVESPVNACLIATTLPPVHALQRASTAS